MAFSKCAPWTRGEIPRGRNARPSTCGSCPTMKPTAPNGGRNGERYARITRARSLHRRSIMKKQRKVWSSVEFNEQLTAFWRARPEFSSGGDVIRYAIEHIA